ncbi:MAG: hypothetical protein A2Z06_04720 [Candidatus Glassbacteria bacterium RBG_16_58_8]|uniref:Aspartate kinase n=1 Tax=Candidatus Glassbacteria bacterium RBG_16_58_8 TaxID=1817866 RepID=A0A1F5YBQ4_9BACT|nr:MAG: hypothetical protein A2Z06_04720 [Candidatus Glassbacteria bacterium RBG_16_58_8]
MEALSKAGAVVMKADAIEYARRHRIIFSLMSSFREGRGTVVGADRSSGDWPVLGLSFDRSILILDGVAGSRAEEVRESVAPKLGELGFAPLSASWIGSSDGVDSSLFMVFREDGIADPPAVPGIVECEYPWMKGRIRLCASVTLITREAGPFGRICSQAIRLLRDEGFELLGYNAVDRCCHFFLPSDDVVPAVRILHGKLFPG